MAGTTGALKTLIEGAGLGVVVVRDRLPKNVRYPAVILSDAVSSTMEKHGDFGDLNADLAVAEFVTVDLFQMWRNFRGYVGESPTLADALFKLIHGASLPTHNKRVYGVRVLSMTRLLEVDLPDGTKLVDSADGANVVHHAYSVIVNRAL